MPGATRPSISRIRMILATDREGTSFLSCIASSTSSSKLAGSFCDRRIFRFMGRRPVKPSLCHAASSRYRVLSEISLFSAILERIWAFFAGSSPSSSSGDIMANRLDAFSSCQVVVSLFFIGFLPPFRDDREIIACAGPDSEPKSVHHRISNKAPESRPSYK